MIHCKKFFDIKKRIIDFEEPKVINYRVSVKTNPFLVEFYMGILPKLITDSLSSTGSWDQCCMKGLKQAGKRGGAFF